MVQDLLQRPILVENASAYLRYNNHSTIDEAEFLGALAEQADCGLLLDVNNAYVNQVNLGQSATALLRKLPLKRVRQVHLAEHEQRDGFVVDAHNDRVAPSVWELFELLQTLKPGLPTLIEWDNDLPPLEVLLDEAARAEQRMSAKQAEAT